MPKLRLGRKRKRRTVVLELDTSKNLRNKGSSPEGGGNTLEKKKEVDRWTLRFFEEKGRWSSWRRGKKYDSFREGGSQGSDGGKNNDRHPPLVKPSPAPKIKG